VRKDVLSMFLNVDNVGAERMSSGRLFQACPGYDRITTSSGTESGKVGNSRNWDAQFVEMTWCQAVDCLVHQKASRMGLGSVGCSLYFLYLNFNRLV